MAYEHYDDEPGTTEEALESLRRAIDEADDRVRKLSELVEDSYAGMRIDITQSRREMLELRAALSRLQARFDNQLLALALANIASGVGVAALVMGVSHVGG